MIYLVFFILTFGLLLILLFRRRRDRAINLAMTCVSLVIGLYFVEGVLEFLAVDPRLRAAWWNDITFDRRAKAQVVVDLRRQGREAQPNVIPSGLVDLNGLATDGGRVFPLAGISSTEVVFCNEAGPWVTYAADEYGFRNPAASHRPGEVDVVLLGDSFVQGQCVEGGQDLAGRLRARGYRTVNLGMSGNGPLIELGALTEYATRLRPAVVVWTIYEGNDAFDLARESRSEILRRYLEPGFCQDLVSRQPEIDETLGRYLEARLGPELARSTVEEDESRAGRFLRLRELESRFLVSSGRKSKPSETKPFDPWMEEVLKEARRRVEAWGGRLCVLYLPETGRSPGREAIRRRNLGVIEGLGLPLVDFSETLAVHPDPDSLFPLRLRLSVHYNGEGYRLLADSLAAQLPAAAK